ncbi:spindle and kinetochore-associated protein 2-like [Actinia tenebrosa]|uniref:Protein FAM33A n=1 Tax=Actinia tenebrosa TaxID=6105 RepID=A0A6P8H8V4_ACTTE|nr:spindle and kinetochore-associated protein 2-like [Actinia tenebrosa]
MESVVDKLEALVQKAESDLNYVSLRLDSQFSRQFSTNGQHQLNPIKLLERIRKAKEELKALSMEATEIHSQQKEVESSLVGCLVPSQHLLQHLQHQTGTKVSEKTTEEEFVVQQWKESSDYSERSLQNCEHHPKYVKEDMEQDKENLEFSSNLSIADADSEQEKPISRKSLKKFLAITEDEFHNVSTLVKGRVKLDAVNKVHEALFNYFKTNKKSSPLTVSDMMEMGLKITGATGQAKLKVLRSLKIIQITNKGAVKWQS